MSDDLPALLDRGFRYAMSLVAEPALAEDLVHDAVTRMLERGAPMHVGYLFTAIRNGFIDTHRHQRLAVIDASEPDDYADEEPALPASIAAADLSRVLADLRAEEREVLFLTAVEGHTLAEVSELTGRPAGTVASLARRGRQRLRRMLSAEGQARRPA